MESRESTVALESIHTLFSAGTVSALSDRELLQRFVTRDGSAAEAAFAALVGRHGAMVMRVCNGVLRDFHASEDAFQATFLILANKARSIRSGDSVASWLFGVARRVALRAKADGARREASERSGAMKSQEDQQASPPADMVSEVQEEVGRLPEKYRAPVVLCYLGGLTHEEAADQLGLPVGTVKVRLHRARGRLRGRLARRGLAPSLLVPASSASLAAMVPAPLVDSIVRAAARIAAGREAVVPASVSALVQGVLRAMFLAKLKTTAALLTASLTLFLASTLALSALPQPAALAQAGGAPVPSEGKAWVVDTVKKSRIERTTRLVGSVQAFESSRVAARFSGYLKSLNVDIGDAVKKGQILATIDAPELDADVEKSRALLTRSEARVSRARAAEKSAAAALDVAQAGAELTSAGVTRAEAAMKIRKAQFARYEELHQKAAVPENVLDDQRQRLEVAQMDAVEAVGKLRTAKATVEEARAKRETAAADIAEAEADVRVAQADMLKTKMLHEFAKVFAPLDGIVTRRNYHEGDFVRSGADGEVAPLLEIVKTDKMRVVVEVPASQAPLLDKGDRATMRVNALGGREYEGVVARTAYAENPETQTLRAEIDLDNADGRLRPGQSGMVTIALESTTALTIPHSAVNPGNVEGIVTCYRVEGGRARLTTILVHHQAEAVEVLNGLKEGDVVIANPRQYLEDGQIIEPEKTERADTKK